MNKLHIQPCWTCRKCYGDCSWSRKDPEPVPGWDAIGDWANGQKPDIGDDKRVISMEPTTRSSLFAMYENGDEDHQILMKLNYEVNV